MPPFLHGCLGFLFSCLGAVAGVGLWSLFLGRDSWNLPAKSANPPSAFGMIFGFGVMTIAFVALVVSPCLGAWALWTRFVPAYCRMCGGRMTIRPGRGRRIIYDCPSCGYEL